MPKSKAGRKREAKRLTTFWLTAIQEEYVGFGSKHSGYILMRREVKETGSSMQCE
jgi:hypothetical protein